MNSIPSSVRCVVLGTSLCGAVAVADNRPPAVPLVAHDPYFSVWSTTDRLTDGPTRHWTGTVQPLHSLIRLDGKPYRLMGDSPRSVPAMPQTRVQVLPTRTIYTFRNGQAEVQLTFTTPTLPDDLDVFSRPATYLTWDIRALDGKSHAASVYFDASALLAVNTPDQKVLAQRQNWKPLNALSIGSATQQVLGKTGDDLRIDWGHLYLAAPASVSYLGSSAAAMSTFARSEILPSADDRKLTDAKSLAAAIVLPFGKVGPKAVRKHAILAYDDQQSIQFFDHNLRPYWRRNGAQASDLLRIAERDYVRLMARTEAFDRELVADATRIGGADYAYICSLAYRQSFAAQKLVADGNGQPLLFPKENFSNGCISTVDVLYPQAPALLLLSPTLAKASLVPVLAYAASPRWKFPFAPHDLGTYPKANGQVYGGGEQTEDNQMPVEETGNMLILLAAIAKIDGNAKFAATYWPQLEKWAGYLAAKGFDPESQLSTDDFAGHLAHNVNLSAKAIEALGAYAYLCDVRGLSKEATRYRNLAKGFVKRWVKESADGDHTRLAFDKPGTWSQKYNLVWDRILRLNLFPSSVFRSELDYYHTVMNRYGVPLDNRRDYTKLDWTIWSGTLTGKRSDLELLAKPVVAFLNATPDRVPMGDWYRTLEPRKEGFQARSVVGGVFIKLLDDAAIWRKYAHRDRVKLGAFAPIPKPPVITQVVPTSEKTGLDWSYTTSRPAADWFKTGYAPNWKTGPAGFGTAGTPGAVVRTEWNTSDIWIRREFNLPATAPKNLRLIIHHDEDAEVYLNGVLVASLGGYTAKYEPAAISVQPKAGRNVIAIHCHQTSGGQYIDAGLGTVREAK